MISSGKDIKAIRLTKLMTAQEAVAFKKILTGQKRQSLVLLFDFIQKKILYPSLSKQEKEKLFKSVFGRNYTRQDDYLLRNELRLLANELSQFLSLEKIKNTLQTDEPLKNLFFLQCLLNKKEYVLFENEYPKALKEAARQCDFETAAKMTRLLIDDFVFRKEATKPNYERLLALTSQYYEYAGNAFLHDYIHVRHKQAFAERTLHAIVQGYPVAPLQPVMFSLDKKSNDNYLEYMRLLTESYCRHGQEKIDALLKAQRLISKIAKKDFDKQAAKATTSAGIALEYFLSGSYRQSLPFHKMALDNASTLPHERVIAFVFNYLSALMRLEQYAEAVRLIEKYRATWEALPRVRDRFLCLKAMNLIFLNDADAAWNCIPPDRKQSGIDHYYYYRFIQILVFYLRGELDLAMNETENFEHTVRYQDKDANYLRLILLMKKFLRLRGEKPALSRKEFEKSKSKLKAEMNLAEIEKRLPDKALLYRWLHHALK